MFPQPAVLAVDVSQNLNMGQIWPGASEHGIDKAKTGFLARATSQDKIIQTNESERLESSGAKGEKMLIMLFS